MVLAGFSLYLVVHFALYAALFRHRRLAATERGVFLYHFVPAALWVIVLGALAFVVPSVGAAHIVLVAALHGIYSLTFLELWALADGGYSLAILDSLESRKDIGELERLGGTKKQARLADLVRMGLVEDRADGYRLTRSGRVAAGFIAAIARLADTPMS